MDLRNYVGYGSDIKNYTSRTVRMFPNGTRGALPADAYRSTRRAGSTACEFAYQQAFTENFGFIGNYTYADGKQTSNVQPSSGDDRLVGTSKNTYNLSGYFENKHVQRARRLHLPVVVLQRSRSQHGVHAGHIGTLSASLGYTINQTLLGHARWS